MDDKEMNVKDLIEELKKMPPDAPVKMIVAYGWENAETEIVGVYREGKYVVLN